MFNKHKYISSIDSSDSLGLNSIEFEGMALACRIVGPCIGARPFGSPHVSFACATVFRLRSRLLFRRDERRTERLRLDGHDGTDTTGRTDDI